MSALDKLIRDNHNNRNSTTETVLRLAEAELATLRADRKEAADVLREAEWGGVGGSCPLCRQRTKKLTIRHAHLTDCRLAALLKRLRKV
jgi:hypothetical protein